ncbi:50S ribosomal protein L10 [Candidatus Dependentiae bacterium]|nr:50S ribosomal protein L10 [Candidatus Dependentiae bacterium]
MNRQQKEQVVVDVREMFNTAEAAFLVNYRGLPVDLMQNLRKQIREASGSFKVTKARLMKIASKDVVGVDAFAENFHDQVGLVFAKNEPTVVAKRIVDFAKKNEALKIVAGFFEAKFLSKEEVVALGSIPSRDVLLATLVYTLQAPMINLVGTLEAKVKKD